MTEQFANNARILMLATAVGLAPVNELPSDSEVDGAVDGLKSLELPEAFASVFRQGEGKQILSRARQVCLQRNVEKALLVELTAVDTSIGALASDLEKVHIDAGEKLDAVVVNVSLSSDSFVPTGGGTAIRIK